MQAVPYTEKWHKPVDFVNNQKREKTAYRFLVKIHNEFLCKAWKDSYYWNS